LGVSAAPLKPIGFLICRLMRTKLEQSEKYALEIFSSDAYLVVNKKLLQHYGPDTAIFLSNLIDKYKYFLDHSVIKDNWFFLTHENQMEQTGLTITRLRNCKKQLKTDLILQTEVRGLGAKEWYKLNLSQIFQVIPLTSRPQESLPLDLQDLTPLDLRNPDLLYKDNKLKENKDNKNKEKDISVPLANFLQKIIEEKKNIRHTPTQIEKWSKDISKLIKTNQVSYERIKIALRWYKDHCRDEYVPVIESGATLREKFLKLEAAMEREQHPYKPKEQPSPNTNGFRSPTMQYREADRHM